VWGDVGGFVLGGGLVLGVVFLFLKACVGVSAWDARRTAAGKRGLPEWNGTTQADVTGTVKRVLGSTRRAKVALNLRPGSGLKPGK
jgi:hypothetical protein